MKEFKEFKELFPENYPESARIFANSIRPRRLPSIASRSPGWIRVRENFREAGFTKLRITMERNGLRAPLRILDLRKAKGNSRGDPKILDFWRSVLETQLQNYLGTSGRFAHNTEEDQQRHLELRILWNLQTDVLLIQARCISAFRDGTSVLLLECGTVFIRSKSQIQKGENLDLVEAKDRKTRLLRLFGILLERKPELLRKLQNSENNPYFEGVSAGTLRFPKEILALDPDLGLNPRKTLQSHFCEIFGPEFQVSRVYGGKERIRKIFLQVWHEDSLKKKGIRKFGLDIYSDWMAEEVLRRKFHNLDLPHPAHQEEISLAVEVQRAQDPKKFQKEQLGQIHLDMKIPDRGSLLPESRKILEILDRYKNGKFPDYPDPWIPLAWREPGSEKIHCVWNLFAFPINSFLHPVRGFQGLDTRTDLPLRRFRDGMPKNPKNPKGEKQEEPRIRRPNSPRNPALRKNPFSGAILYNSQKRTQKKACRTVEISDPLSPERARKILESIRSYCLFPKSKFAKSQISELHEAILELHHAVFPDRMLWNLCLESARKAESDPACLYRFLETRKDLVILAGRNPAAANLLLIRDMVQEFIRTESLLNEFLPPEAVFETNRNYPFPTPIQIQKVLDRLHLLPYRGECPNPLVSQGLKFPLPDELRTPDSVPRRETAVIESLVFGKPVYDFLERFHKKDQASLKKLRKLPKSNTAKQNLKIREEIWADALFPAVPEMNLQMNLQDRIAMLRKLPGLFPVALEPCDPEQRDRTTQIPVYSRKAVLDPELRSELCKLPLDLQPRDRREQYLATFCSVPLPDGLNPKKEIFLSETFRSGIRNLRKGTDFHHILDGIAETRAELSHILTGMREFRENLEIAFTRKGTQSQGAYQQFQEDLRNCIQNLSLRTPGVLGKIQERWAVQSPKFAQTDHLAELQGEYVEGRPIPKSTLRDQHRWPALLKRPFQKEISLRGKNNSCVQVRELNSPQDLVQNGAEMEHCVAMMSRECLGTSQPVHILEFRDLTRDVPLATASVGEKNPPKLRKICIKGPRNRDPDPALAPLFAEAIEHMQKGYTEAWEKRADQKRREILRRINNTGLSPESPPGRLSLWWKWQIWQRILPELPDLSESLVFPPEEKALDLPGIL